MTRVCVVLGEGGDQLGCFDVGLVSERGEAGETEPVVGCDQRELESEVAALGDEPDLTGRKLAPADVERGRRVVDAEAVRAEQDRTGGPDAIDDRLLAGAACVVLLAEPGGDADDRPGAGRKGAVHGFLEAGRRNGDDDELGRCRENVERAERGLTEDLSAAAVDEVDVPSGGAAERAAGESVAPFDRIVGRADDRHRARVEQRTKVARHRRCRRVHPSSRREMMSRWMSDVPSSISSSLASRIHFSTGYSRE